MVPATLVLFAIQASLRIGRKVYDLYVENNLARPILLPLGELAGDPFKASAVIYLRENSSWIEAGGPLHNIWDGEDPGVGDPIRAYQVLLGTMEIDSNWDEARQIISGLQKFEQYKNRQKRDLQQILGEVINIGLDFAKINPFFKIDPESMQTGSAAQRVIGAFVTHLDEIDFGADKSLFNIGGNVLTAGLEVFGDSANLITRDARLQLLFRDVTKALVEDIDANKFGTDGEDFLKRIAGSVLRGAMNGVIEDPALFIRGDSKGTEFIRTVVKDVLNGLKDQKDLFTPASLEIIFKNSMVAVSESAGLVTNDKFLQDLIHNTLGVLTKPGQKIFTEATFAGIVGAALETVANNAGSLIKTTGPQRQFLVEGLTALTESLATPLVGGEFKNLFTTNELLDLTRVVFADVGLHPEALLGNSTDPLNSILAQIITAVAGAIKDDPTKLVSAEGYLQILDSALRVGAQNSDKILKPLDQSKPLITPLYQLLKGLLESAPDLAGSLHSGNFPAVFEKVLRQYLLGMLDTPDKAKIAATAKTILTTS
jgi:hypothetical protein